MKEMKTLTIEDKTYEIVDEYSRNCIEQLNIETTEDGGQVFNDVETNEAIAPFSTAGGTECRAGIYGYRLLAVSVNEDGTRNITVDDTSEEVDIKASEAYAIDDNLCFDGQSHYYDNLTIVGFDTDVESQNSIIVVSVAEGTLKPELIVPEIITDETEDPDAENWVWVPEKPEHGVPMLGSWGAYANGIRSVAVGYAAVAIGRENKALGNYSYAVGRENTALYAAYAEGKGNYASGQHSHAEGTGTTAIGIASHAEGNKTLAFGYRSHAEGTNTTSYGNDSHAEGSHTMSFGSASHVEGSRSASGGAVSHTEGNSNVTGKFSKDGEGNFLDKNGVVTTEPSEFVYISGGSAAHAEGYKTQAEGNYSHTEGGLTLATSSYAHAEGNGSKAVGTGSHAEGHQTEAVGTYSHTEGYTTKADGPAAHAEGRETQANGYASHAEGRSAVANGYASHVEGVSTVAVGKSQHVQGIYNVIDEVIRDAEGNMLDHNGNITEDIAQAASNYASIIGNGTSSKRSNAHTIDWNGNAWFAGDVTVGADKEVLAKKSDIPETFDASKITNLVGKKVGNNSEIFNNYTKNVATGNYSHAEGHSTEAIGSYAHAEGYLSKVFTNYSHVEGYGSVVGGKITEKNGVEGYHTGTIAHAEGRFAEAHGNNSHAEGNSTLAVGSDSHVQGKYNIPDVVLDTDGNWLDENGEITTDITKSKFKNTYAHIVGNGTSSKRSNAHTLDWSGNGWFAGDIKIGGTGYADENARRLSVTYKGTSEPDSKLGTDGDIYIMYNEG